MNCFNWGYAFSLYETQIIFVTFKNWTIFRSYSKNYRFWKKKSHWKFVNFRKSSLYTINLNLLRYFFEIILKVWNNGQFKRIFTIKNSEFRNEQWQIIGDVVKKSVMGKLFLSSIIKREMFKRSHSKQLIKLKAKSIEFTPFL